MRAFAAVLLAFPLAVFAADGPLEGTFVAKGSAQGTIDAAIDKGVAEMNFVKRPIARRRLKSTNLPYGRVVIQRSPQTISVTFDANTPIVMPLDGTPIKWTRADGEVFDVHAQSRDDRLVQTFKSEDGQRVNEFSLAGNDGLQLSVTISSPQLPTPVTYTLEFVRER
jgi:hypothetical protein